MTTTRISAMQPETKQKSKVISVRLPYDVYLQLWDFCVKEDHNFNSGMKELIKTHPQLTNGREQGASLQS